MYSVSYVDCCQQKHALLLLRSLVLASSLEMPVGTEPLLFADQAVNYRYTAWMNGFETFQTDMQAFFEGCRPVDVEIRPYLTENLVHAR
jgi:hypothetical protein